MEALCYAQTHGHPSLSSTSPVVYTKSLSRFPFPPLSIPIPLPCQPTQIGDAYDFVIFLLQPLTLQVLRLGDVHEIVN